MQLTLCCPTLFGLEGIVADELRFGGRLTDVHAENGRVLFTGDENTLAWANLNLRCAERVLIRIGTFKAKTFDQLFEGVKALPWEQFIPADGAFPVKGHSLDSALHSIPDCQKIIKKAVVSRLGAKYGQTWFDEIGEKYQIQFAIMHDVAELYLDTSGAGLHKRGYRANSNAAPLCDNVLEILAAHGAPADIVKKAKPHVGTDILKNVVREMRREIIKNGGEVRFRTPLTGVSVKNGALCAVEADGQDIACERAVLAIGHSARDTFAALHGNGVYFEPKAFSVGVRIEHLQTEIDRALYGKAAGHPMLPPAEYNLSRRADGRACYSFCMCPGGVVVAAQSEENTVVTNGMSYHARDGKNANAALAVSVDPKDYDDGTPFGGVALQRRIEHAAYTQTGSYRAPCQKVGDFLNGKPTRKLGAVKPSYPIGVELGEAAACLPDFAQTMLRDSLPYFGRKIRGYDTADALLTGPETRTSSPVRMTRGEDLFGLGCSGIIPCGEGSGYAGGIMSAAVDGIRAAFRIMEEFAN